MNTSLPETELNQKLKLALHSTNEGVALLDKDGLYYYLNPAHVTMFGYDKEEELIGKPWQFIYDESEYERINKDIFPLLIKNGFWKGETIGKSKGGEPVYQEISLTFMDDGGIICVARDISEKLQKLKTLRLHNEILEQTNSMIIITNADRKILWVNEAFEKKTGYSREEVLGKNPGKLLQGENSDQNEINKLKNAINTSSSFDFELVNYTKNKVPYWINIKGKPIFDKQGNIEYYFAVQEDITAIKENEKKLKEYNLQLSEQNLMLKLFVDAAGVALWEWDIKADKVLAGDDFAALLGFDSFDDMPEFYSDQIKLVHPEDVSILQQNITKHFEGTSNLLDLEYRVKMQNSDIYKWVNAKGKVIERKEDGTPLRAAGIIYDIQERKEAELMLEKAKQAAETSIKAKRRFLANISHELRTPLHAINGLGKQLEQTNLNEQQSSYLRMMNESGEGLLAIINDLLDYSKIEEGKMYLQSITFNPQKIFYSVFNLFESQAFSKKLYFKTEKIDAALNNHFKGDPIRVRQILINIISNAIKFTQNGGVLLSCHLETNDEKNWLNFICSDTGIGMSDEMQLHLFEKFVQEDDSFQRKYGGSGLGLPITKELVGLMGGFINVESVKDKGTTVTIRVPLADGVASEEQSQDTENLTPVVPGNFNDIRILAAEDNHFNRMLLKIIFDKHGLQYEFAKNGIEAVYMTQEKEFDIILMDIQMPEMDGLEATEEIRKLRGSILPIIALTANAVKEELESYLQKGITGYIVKPFEEDKLLQLLQKYVGAKN